MRHIYGRNGSRQQRNETCENDINGRNELQESLFGLTWRYAKSTQYMVSPALYFSFTLTASWDFQHIQSLSFQSALIHLIFAVLIYTQRLHFLEQVLPPRHM